MVRPEGEVGELLKKFVPVRMVQGNGMDLSVFQFDYDMSFAVFFLDADKTIYGRYGTRTQSGEDKSDSEISMAGLAASMREALELHTNKAKGEGTRAFAGKKGLAPKYSTPEANPLLRKYKPKIEFGPNVAKSCVHCHQVRNVERLALREAGEPISDRVLFPYPMPDVLGLTFDKQSRATISAVSPGSKLAAAGIAVGDELKALSGQPITSVADVQWVLENVPAEGGSVSATFSGGKEAKVDIDLADGWRRQGDISWRVSTWDLRRMALGGMKLEPLPASERKRLGLEGKMALLAKHVGQHNDHAVAKRAGVKKGDVLIEFDGLRDDLREADVIAHAVQKRKAGEVVEVKMLRGDQTKAFRIRLQ